MFQFSELESSGLSSSRVEQTENSISECTSSTLLRYLKQFGNNSLAFSSLQDGLQAFHEPGCGYIAYADTAGLTETIRICLSDPVCASEHKETILKKFLEPFNNPVFIHVFHDTARILNKMGFYVNEMGVETIIDVQDFTLAGNKKQFLRSQRNRALKDGLKVIEADADTISADMMLKISQLWMQEKTVNTNELSLIARPAVYEHEPGVRKFFALKDGEPVGFVFFDPIYKNRQTVGYLANILRSIQNCSYSICDFIILEAMEIFRQEGIHELSLGVSPFANINDNNSFTYSKPTQALFKSLFKYANHLYAFKLLAFHKERYRPGEKGCRQHKVYCASKTVFPALCLYACLSKIGINPLPRTCTALRDEIKTLPTKIFSGILKVAHTFMA